MFQIRSKQEHDLKARNFLPPQAADPEMFVIDGRADPARANGQLSDTPEGERESAYMVVLSAQCRSKCWAYNFIAMTQHLAPR